MILSPDKERNFSVQGPLARYDTDYRKGIKKETKPFGSRGDRLKLLSTANVEGLLNGLSGEMEGLVPNEEDFSKSYKAGTLKNILELKGTINKNGTYVVKTDSLDPQALSQLSLLAKKGETDVPVTMQILNSATQWRQRISKDMVPPQNWSTDKNPDAEPIPFSVRKEPVKKDMDSKDQSKNTTVENE